MLAALAWRNIWRQPHRTWLSLASIVIAGIVTVFLLSLQRGVYGSMEESVLNLMDGYAQIQPEGYKDDPDLRKAIDDPASLAVQLAAIPGVTATAPRATSYVILSHGDDSFGGAVIGVDPAREPKVSRLHGAMTQGRYLQQGDDAAAVMGEALARNLGLKPGDKVTMLGAGRDGSVAADIVQIVGVFSSGSPELDRQVLEIPLARFQETFAMDGRVNVIAVSGAHLDDIDAALPALRAAAKSKGLVALGWTDLQPALRQAILLDISFSTLIYGSLVAVVAFILMNMLLMSVLERTREFGVLLALGMRPSQIARMAWLELMMIAGAGAALGAAGGAALALWTAHIGIHMSDAEVLFSRWDMPSTLYPRLDLVSAFAGPVALAVSITLAGIVPYLHILRLRPVPAMRAT